ncbi:hypothetical protein TNCV_3491161 [Trichonephila clavipes]|nr:hypothetical protein TNCV_3491161 [Trichonephila clavipes]
MGLQLKRSVTSPYLELRWLERISKWQMLKILVWIASQLLFNVYKKLFGSGGETGPDKFRHKGGAMSLVGKESQIMK